jgi:CheY-specific phosphatase CheX
MSTPLKNSLFEATVAAFEQAAFMAVSRTPSEAQRAQAIESAVAVDIDGVIRGRMVLGLSANLFPQLAGNMLGDDTPLPADQQRDALGEMANIIAGVLLPALSGTDAVFRLAAPRLVNLEEERPLCTTALELGIDDGRVELLLELERTAVEVS